VDSGFESYFKDLEGINTKDSLNTDEIIKGIEKDSGGTLKIDLDANVSKLSLAGSQYSFDEGIDREAISEVKAGAKSELDALQNSSAVLAGLYRPFDSLLSNIRASW